MWTPCFLVLVPAVLTAQDEISCLPRQRATPLQSTPCRCSRDSMPTFTPQLKHHILLQHRSNPQQCSFAELARRYAVKGGRELVRQWHQRWDGTPQSLERKGGSGRARALSAAQVSRHVRAPILAANRAHRAIHYTELLPAVRQKTGTEVSLRSLQRYGKEELGARDKHSKKRTAEESECNSTAERRDVSLSAELAS